MGALVVVIYLFGGIFVASIITAILNHKPRNIRPRRYWYE